MVLILKTGRPVILLVSWVASIFHFFVFIFCISFIFHDYLLSLMSPYVLRTTREFEERFNKLTKRNKSLVEMFSKAILKLKVNPYVGKPLSHDLKGLWSLPIAGKWRVIYEIDENRKLVILRSIGHRKRIYSDFS